MLTSVILFRYSFPAASPDESFDWATLFCLCQSLWRYIYKHAWTLSRFVTKGDTQFFAILPLYPNLSDNVICIRPSAYVNTYVAPVIKSNRERHEQRGY